MAVKHLQSLVSRVATTVADAGRVVKTTAYRQPQAFLSLPSRLRVRMPNRMRGHERSGRVRLDHEAALAVRTGRSAGSTGGLPHQSRPHAPRADFGTRRVPATLWPTGKRPSKSFSPRIELSKPCAWGCRFEG